MIGYPLSFIPWSPFIWKPAAITFCYYLYSLPLCASTGKGPSFHSGLFLVTILLLRIRSVFKTMVSALGSFDHILCFQRPALPIRTLSFSCSSLCLQDLVRLWKMVGDLLGYWLRLQLFTLYLFSCSVFFFSYLLHKSIVPCIAFPLFFLCLLGLFALKQIATFYRSPSSFLVSYSNVFGFETPKIAWRHLRLLFCGGWTVASVRLLTTLQPTVHSFVTASLFLVYYYIPLPSLQADNYPSFP